MLIETDKQYFDLGNPSHLAEAMRARAIRPTDSPKGFLCTLCGSIVASTDTHTDYHRGQRDFMKTVLLKLGLMSVADIELIESGVITDD